MAPAPAPLVVDTEELEMQDSEIENMVTQKQEIEEQIKLLREKEKLIDRYFKGKFDNNQ